MASKERIELSKRLSDAKAEKKLSYRALERITGISRATIQRYVENPETKISYENLAKLSKAFGIEISDLAGMKEVYDDLWVSYDPEHENLDETVRRHAYEFATIDAVYKFDDDEANSIFEYAHFVGSKKK